MSKLRKSFKIKKIAIKIFFKKNKKIILISLGVLVILLALLFFFLNKRNKNNISTTNDNPKPKITGAWVLPENENLTSTVENKISEDDQFNGHIIIGYKGETIEVSGKNKIKNIDNKNFSELKQFNGFPKIWDNEANSRIINKVIVSKDKNQIILRIANIDKTKPINEMTNEYDFIPDNDYLCDFTSQECTTTELLTNIEKNNKFVYLTGFDANKLYGGTQQASLGSDEAEQAIVYDIKSQKMYKTPKDKSYDISSGFFDDLFSRIALVNPKYSSSFIDIFSTDNLNEVKKNINISNNCEDVKDGIYSISWSDKYIVIGTRKTICLVNLENNNVSTIYIDTTPTRQVGWGFHQLKIDYPYVYFIDYISNNDEIISEQILKSINLENENKIKSLLTKPMSDIFSDFEIILTNNNLYIPNYWDSN